MKGAFLIANACPHSKSLSLGRRTLTPTASPQGEGYLTLPIVEDGLIVLPEQNQVHLL